ncbi:TetR/AcrR family transcriptional regulator [Pseudomonas donghuensis]|uniref:TetR/AcrR family transcriptional regulator n=1 Tax=Pseudomonas donghuensis TaxID=1163398 RepID=A0AAP0X906_9PSED|nr:TetR/AcrR family transcriptional regulator [Pseudomonas donghuensis]MDF9893152.1 AcrR family transcriptional regulator [Pseudomonas vranovensis]KDN98630.1 TetR/AcrR family transcriptional regulator [Pseudomonas donghuensis]MCP6691084.1 TetR/AcrR family transcriptional regulator [Pseudomonas donghuensis]PJY95865.1 TetR/AcrR family transcriptional regulator [Pseudomonas donghuensis]WKY30652.1 helix-turn-helix domain-containing protein [Pseudomonas donghuensis]
MRSLTPSAEKICAIAVEQFAELGYDASSLNDIAAAAGMRKPSLYAHFAGKDDLFQVVYARALHAEHEYLEACFAEKVTAGELPGQRFAERLNQRYQASAHLRFMLRTAFFPPSELRPVICAGFEAYLARLGELFTQALRRYAPALDEQQQRLYGDAYLGIVDSLNVELIYAGAGAFERRLAALWRLFGESLARL